MKYRQWNELPSGREDSALCQAGIPALCAKVLAARGMDDPEEARRFLLEAPPLDDPLGMMDMDLAVERLETALEQGEIIAVFGDYDVDGITATCLLTDFLRREGAVVIPYIPNRLEEGYGLNNGAMEKLHRRGARLVVTVDCGVTAVEETAYANALGMDVVITDHHACKEALPDAVAVVDPHRPDCEYPFKHLAGVGVALKLCMALAGPERDEELLDTYADLCALGTVADVMELTQENRTLVRHGMDVLARTRRPGLRALLKETGAEGKTLSSIALGFTLAPRLNAAGRMGRAEVALELLLTEDPARAEELAITLCDLNRERQAVEQNIYADALDQIERLSDEERSALVLASNHWHQGVVGIVASRLSEKFSCPSFMIHIKDGVGKGSCRSYGNFNVFSALESCASLLDGFGGHALAAGFTIQEEQIPTFRERMNRCVRAASGGALPVSSLDVDAAILCPADMTLWEAEQLEALEPYGAGNPRPVFALLGATVDAVQSVGQGRHLKLRLSRGLNRFDAIFFSVTAEECGVFPGMRVDAAFHLQANTFRGNTTLQLQLLDIRPSLVPSRHESMDLELIKRLLAGTSLTAQEVDRLRSSRNQFAACWVALIHHLSHHGRTVVDTLPFLRTLAAEAGGSESFLRAALSLAVFQERGLLDIRTAEDTLSIARIPNEEKVDLSACPYLLRLHGRNGNGKRGDL